MPDATIVEETHATKANMDGIYVQPDPRAYFRELARLNYQIPDHAKPIFERLIAARRATAADDAPLTLVDLGCSYGINAALLKYDLDMATLYDRWCDPTLDGLAPETVIANDQRFFGAMGGDAQLQVVGLDQSQPAIAYAREAKLLDGGIAENLEEAPITDADAGQIAPADLIVSTGCVGYVGEATFARVLSAAQTGTRPWFANFVLRMFPFDDIAETLADHGYVTEKLDGRTFVQRDFVSADEEGNVLDELKALDLDPAGFEASGQYHAEFFLSRPRAEAEAVPLDRLLAA